VWVASLLSAERCDVISHEDEFVLPAASSWLLIAACCGMVYGIVLRLRGHVPWSTLHVADSLSVEKKEKMTNDDFYWCARDLKSMMLTDHRFSPKRPTPLTEKSQSQQNKIVVKNGEVHSCSRLPSSRSTGIIRILSCWSDWNSRRSNIDHKRFQHKSVPITLCKYGEQQM